MMFERGSAFARWNGPFYLVDLRWGRFSFFFWEHDALTKCHLSWKNDIFAFHLTLWPFIITVDAKGVTGC